MWWSDLVTDYDHLDDFDLIRKIEKRSRSLYFRKTKKLAASRCKVLNFYQYQNDGFGMFSFISKQQNVCCVLDCPEPWNRGEGSSGANPVMELRKVAEQSLKWGEGSSISVISEFSLFPILIRLCPATSHYPGSWFAGSTCTFPFPISRSTLLVSSPQFQALLRYFPLPRFKVCSATSLVQNGSTCQGTNIWNDLLKWSDLSPRSL